MTGDGLVFPHLENNIIGEFGPYIYQVIIDESRRC